MANPNVMDPMLEAYLFDTEGQVDNLEQAVLSTEDGAGYTEEIINNIFRYMHTIKGSSAMMMFNNISTVAHSTEDLFFFIRENKATNYDSAALSDIVLEAIDFIKLELEKIKNGDPADGDETQIITTNKAYLENLKENADGVVVEAPKKAETSKPKPIYVSSSTVVESGGTPIYKAKVFFEEDAKMENIRAFVLVNNLKDVTGDIKTVPKDVLDADNGADLIARDGFLVYFKADIPKEEAEKIISKTPVVEKFELTVVEDPKEYDNLYGEEQVANEVKQQAPIVPEKVKLEDAKGHEATSAQSMISINVSKLDSLMDLVGELVIAEAMVTQNPDIQDLELENFSKAARQLQKIAKSIQDNVLGMRLVPLKATFMKMNRAVRDMNRKLDKKVHLRMIGENTEVDKNIIEHIGDPIMHLVRNALDHGIETNEERISAGKSEQGIVTLEAKNVGNEVHIIVSDDGKGLDKTKLLKKAQDNDLLKKPPEEMTDQEIYNLIMLPGFSTKKQVSEFSGRGVGMDVVCKNIEAIGGTLDINSELGHGSSMRMKIPLTLAIIAGMSIKISDQHYTIPISGIKELIKPDSVKIFKNANNSEMLMVRGECYPILRLHEFFDVETDITDFNDGMFIMVETNTQTICLFCDELIGKHQIVVKSLPEYFKDLSNSLKGISGCTLLGNGSISLIIDVNSLAT